MNDGRRIVAAAALAAVAAALAGCGGGSGGGAATALPDPGGAMPDPGPAMPPAPTPSPVPPAPRGATAASGIERIPLDARRAANAQVAELYAIMEYRASNDGGDTPDGGTVHGRTVRGVACRSYIAGCSDPDGAEGAIPYSFSIASALRESPLQQTRELLAAVPDTTRIVSISVRPRSVGPVELHGAGLPFAVIQGAGNDGRASFFDPGVEYDAAAGRFVRVRSENRRDDEGGGSDVDAPPVTEEQNAAWLNILAAVEADKVLYVAGYRPPAGGLYTRHSESTGCAGIDDGCLFAPFTIEEARGKEASGTSVSAPQVASALASVLSVFPETAAEELVRLAKACAVSDPRLGGLGRADFSCMTTLGADGQWRVVASGEFAQLVAAPAAMNAIAFPGDARMAAAFAGPNGQRVTLATRSPGRFRFSAGPPADPFGGAEGEPGFFAILVDDGRATAFGGGWLSPEGLFAAASWGGRDGFFGLDDRFGYDGARSTDAAAGHRNLFARFSRQRARGPLVGSARGAALGFTARTAFDLAPGVSAEVSAHADRFLGGTARTAFGRVTMEKSPWSREARVSAAWRPTPAASLAVEGAQHWSPGGEGGLEGRLRARVRF